MRGTRFHCLVAAVGLGLAGLVPAEAAPPPPAPRLAELDPSRALRTAAIDLVRAPAASTAATWRAAVLRSLTDDSGSADGGRPEYSFVASAGDLDDDRREDVMVLREGETVVRSGKDGRVLLRRPSGRLLPVTGAGAVRLVAVDVEYRDQLDSMELVVHLSGLDRAGRAVWEHELTGGVTMVGAGPAYLARYDSLPLLLHPVQDAADQPGLMLGSLTGVGTPVGLTTRVDLVVLSIADGTVSALPALHGSGFSIPWALPLDEPGCYVANEPVAAATRVSLLCDGSPVWTRPVPLMDPYAVPAGDFDGDGRSDLMLTTFGFERPQPEEVLRGTRVLSFTDGTQVGSSTVDGLVPLGADVDGDAQPDFIELAFEDMGFAVQGVTLAGDVLYRRSIELRGNGMLEAWLGLDVTGDGVGDGFLRATPDRGSPLAAVVDGRDGRTVTVPGVDALLTPGLRATGADLLVLETDKRRLRAAVHSGEGGRPLLSAVVPGPAGAVAPGSAGTVDADGDGRRDLVVVSRRDSTRLTTAFTARGRVLWQQSEKAAAAPDSDEVIVVG